MVRGRLRRGVRTRSVMRSVGTEDFVAASARSTWLGLGVGLGEGAGEGAGAGAGEGEGEGGHLKAERVAAERAARGGPGPLLRAPERDEGCACEAEAERGPLRLVRPRPRRAAAISVAISTSRAISRAAVGQQARRARERPGRRALARRGARRVGVGERGRVPARRRVEVRTKRRVRRRDERGRRVTEGGDAAARWVGGHGGGLGEGAAQQRLELRRARARLARRRAAARDGRWRSVSEGASRRLALGQRVADLVEGHLGHR